LHDSLAGKLFNFTYKNSLKTQVRGNCSNRLFCNIPRKPLNKNSIMPLEGYYEPMPKEKNSKFSLAGKHLLGETNFPFDIGSKKDL
jgi:hypothetical protein